MIPSASHAAVIAGRLESCRAPIVLDPVMVVTSGRPLMAPDTLAILHARLFPLATCVTHIAALSGDERAPLLTDEVCQAPHPYPRAASGAKGR
jgi:Phosphomethylpyrimidine kinase